MNAAISLLENRLSQRVKDLNLAESQMNLHATTLQIKEKDFTKLSVEVSDLRNAVNLIKGSPTVMTLDEYVNPTVTITIPETQTAPVREAPKDVVPPKVLKSELAHDAYKKYVAAYKDANLADPNPEVIEAKQGKRLEEAENAAEALKSAIDAGATFSSLATRFGVTPSAVRRIVSKYGK